MSNENETVIPTKRELIEMLEQMISNIENLPPGAMLQPITHYDHCSLMILLAAFFKSDLHN